MIQEDGYGDKQPQMRTMVTSKSYFHAFPGACRDPLSMNPSPLAGEGQGGGCALLLNSSHRRSAMNMQEQVRFRWIPTPSLSNESVSARAHALHRKALQNAVGQAVPDLAIGIEAHFPAALDHGGIEGVPEFDLAGHVAGHFDGPVLRLW
jgi:hypothetical protein